MRISDLTTTQLDRVYRRIYRSLPDGGMFGWDWRTIDMLYPAKADLLREILRAVDQKQWEDEA